MKGRSQKQEGEEFDHFRRTVLCGHHVKFGLIAEF